MKKKLKFRELGLKQQRVILEFLRGSSLTYAEIARKSGISPRTLQRWRQDARFKEVLEQEVDELKLQVLKTSGMVIEVNALSNSLTRDVELVNFAYMGERVYKLEREHSDFKNMLKLIVKELHKLENDIMELRAHLMDNSHEIRQD